MEEHALYDLHLHTGWSYDAESPVEAVFRAARERGILRLAITDHHVIDSFSETAAAAARYPEITWIPSAELTVTTAIGGVDLLCYGLPREPPASLAAVLEEYHEWQRALGAALCAGMQAIGFDYTDAHREALLRSYRPEKAIRRQGFTHVKNGIQRHYFLERGFIQTPEEYSQVLARARRARPTPPCPAVARVAPAVKEAGALVVIAHPHGYFAGGDRARMEALRDECRLDGVECAHVTVPPEMAPVYRAWCVERGLLSTAGSDCHNPEDLETMLGKHGGPAEWWDEIAARLKGK
ncbi:MAG: PHP domain-containing protein [Armatimonadetes bacterium]|nr:PHP domain-containing protein [Armatimonadota bacterium]